MILTDHDPIRDHAECALCNEALRRAFNRLADMELGPHDVDMLMWSLQEIADGYISERVR